MTNEAGVFGPVAGTGVTVIENAAGLLESVEAMGGDVPSFDTRGRAEPSQ